MKKKILIVDNNQLMLMGLSRALNNPFLDVTTALTGENALEKIHSNSFDLCLLDVHLSDFNGLELMEVIKDSQPQTKIIIMTASHLDQRELSLYMQEYAIRGAFDFITKPFSVCEILDIVGIALKQKGDFQLNSGCRKNEADGKRKKARRPFVEGITFFLTVIHEGEERRWAMPAQSIDISDDGIGLLTQYPLKKSHIIGFGDDLDRKSGVVAWSLLQDKQNYRAGIKFA